MSSTAIHTKYSTRLG